ncbi:unnamed protein product, partial [Lymnaea stagnalis]
EPYEEAIDEASCQKLMLRFKKRVFRKQEKITNLTDLSERFIDSGLDSQEIKKQILATNQEDRQILVNQKGIQSNLYLVSHDNTDVSFATNDMLQEITDHIKLNKNEDTTIISVDTTLGDQVITVLANDLECLQPVVKGEFEEVLKNLTIKVDTPDINLKLFAEVAQPVLTQMWWKGPRLKRQLDDNISYSGRIQAVSPDLEGKRRQFRELDVIYIWLQNLASRKKHDQEIQDEVELRENPFNFFASCLRLEVPANRLRFLRGE